MRAIGGESEPGHHGEADSRRARAEEPLVPTHGSEAERRATPSHESVAAALLASARHELRSPLQSIQGFAELLECQHYGPLGDEQQAFVKHVLQGSNELGVTLEACFELLELELELRPLELARTSVLPLLGEALTRAAESCGCVLRLAPTSGLASARAKLDESAIRRAIEALVMAVAPGKEPLTAQLTVEGEYVCLRVARVAGPYGAALRSVEELAAGRRAGRGLVWLRLSASLVARHEGLLSATDQAERAEVRLRLSSTH